MLQATEKIRLQFDRDRTALLRHELSRPVRRMLADDLLTLTNSFFDYGCGRGGDVKRLAAMGFLSSGWDPVHRPETNRDKADVVNLGYVVNVIESEGERADVLRSAWGLAKRHLVVSARLRGELSGTKPVSHFADGVVTQRGTFQKFFDQEELRQWIEAVLSVTPVAAAPGIYYVFREEIDRSRFLAARYRRTPLRPQLSRPHQLVSSHQDLFDGLSNFVATRGRPPGPDEWADYERLMAVAGTMQRCMSALQKAMPVGSLEKVERARSEDLMLFLALARFYGRPDFHQLDLSIQRDVKAFFGSYKHAVAEADRALLSLGSSGERDTSLASSAIGKLLPSALYLHVSAVPAANLMIRLYEGCARHYLGTIEESNIVKLARGEPRVSFLTYPTFDSDPHPALSASTSVGLQTFQIRDRRYDRSDNPPILHRKEAFLDRTHPSFKKFAKLTRQEENLGLYDDPSKIGTRNGWMAILEERGLVQSGGRILKKDRLGHL